MGDKFINEIPKENANAKAKIFMGHGDLDVVVQYEWGQKTMQSLKGWGWDVDFKTYSHMGHSACPEELSDLENYIAARLKETEDDGSAKMA
jgi:lysophospholipase-1